MRKLKEFKPGEFRLGPAVALHGAPLEASDLTMALFVDHAEGMIRVAFTARVQWFGVDAEAARTLAQRLVELAEQLERRRT